MSKNSDNADMISNNEPRQKVGGKGILQSVQVETSALCIQGLYITRLQDRGLREKPHAQSIAPPYKNLGG